MIRGTASVQPSYYHLVSQHKRSKTCTNKGPETKFPEIFDELFARANSDDKACMTNETSKDICYKKQTNKQLTKCSYLHKHIRFATENLRFTVISFHGHFVPSHFVPK